jgi:y4mF family transcriptional regulator
MIDISNMKELGRAIRDRRRELGYTQAFLADYAGVSASFLSELENGKKTIQLEKAIQVAMLLGMDLTMEARGKA